MAAEHAAVLMGSLASRMVLRTIALRLDPENGLLPAGALILGFVVGRMLGSNNPEQK
jgi:uncharacterized membrane protein AbrB (regulator of aidB expression)